MAHHQSAIRQQRRSVRRTAINKSNTSAVRTQVKKLRALVDNKDKESAKKLLPVVFSTIDRAVKKRAIDKNTGSRYKSRLNRQVELINPSPAK
ncbi:MAG: 30S ribosomal protein S20 [Candidatus Aminicenantes bacterium]|jgi:small subunit ribosomal protein S20|nr:30S ribosomal protein S20 [Candidatus Aminicenantes bacterium]